MFSARTRVGFGGRGDESGVPGQIGESRQGFIGEVWSRGGNGNVEIMRRDYMLYSFNRKRYHQGLEPPDDPTADNS